MDQTEISSKGCHQVAAQLKKPREQHHMQINTSGAQRQSGNFNHTRMWYLKSFTIIRDI